jgi:hypothetical protein
MKSIIALFLLITSLSAFSIQENKISGVVNLPNELKSRLNPNGVLFVFAKKNKMKGQPPIAVTKIINPKFPQAFSITEQNIMITGATFENSMYIMARYSPTGNPMSSPDSLEGTDTHQETAKKGTSNLKIILKENTITQKREIKIPMH